MRLIPVVTVSGMIRSLCLLPTLTKYGSIFLAPFVLVLFPRVDRPRVSRGRTPKSRTLRRFLSIIGDVSLFLALSFILYVTSAAIAAGRSCQTGCGLAVIFLLPLALVLFLAGARKYRLWENRLYWILFAVFSAVIFAGISPRELKALESIVETLAISPILALVPAMLVWQVIMTISGAARTLRSSRGNPHRQS